MNSNIKYVLWLHKYKSTFQLINTYTNIIRLYVAYLVFVAVCMCLVVIGEKFDKSQSTVTQVTYARENYQTETENLSAIIHDEEVATVAEPIEATVCMTDVTPVSYTAQPQVQEVQKLESPTDKIVYELEYLYKMNNKERVMYLRDSVNVRTQPTTESSVIKTLHRNMSVTVLSSYLEWSLVRLQDGTQAYMCNKWFTTEQNRNSYTEEDLYILSHLLAGEAQPCPDIEQQYVASVVMNRVKHRGYPNTLKEVVFQKGQYSCVTDGNYYRTPTEANIRNAKYILEYGSILPAEVVFQARGKQGTGVYIQTEYHCYCYY